MILIIYGQYQIFCFAGRLAGSARVSLDCFPHWTPMATRGRALHVSWTNTARSLSEDWIHQEENSESATWEWAPGSRAVFFADVSAKERPVRGSSAGWRNASGELRRRGTPRRPCRSLWSLFPLDNQTESSSKSPHCGLEQAMCCPLWDLQC